MKVSDRGIALVKEFEGFVPHAYLCPAGKNTIGYGHVILRGEMYATLTESEATALLCRDLEKAEACIEDAVDVDLTQGQFDALADFVFNLGCAAFKGSTLLKRLNAGDFAGAKSELPKWCRIGQNESDGLLRRRLAEQLLFA